MYSNCDVDLDTSYDAMYTQSAGPSGFGYSVKDIVLLVFSLVYSGNFFLSSMRF